MKDTKFTMIDENGNEREYEVLDRDTKQKKFVQPFICC